MASREEQEGQPRRLDDLSKAELELIDEMRRGAGAFSETALSGLAKGVPGLIVGRQMQINEQARQGVLSPVELKKAEE